jgi:hypothetical protein
MWCRPALDLQPAGDTTREWARLHRRLTEQLVDSANLPDDFPWPLDPALA